MMGLDQARAGGGEGMLSKAREEKKPPVFESEDRKVELKIPDGWSAKKTKDQEAH